MHSVFSVGIHRWKEIFKVLLCLALFGVGQTLRAEPYTEAMLRESYERVAGQNGFLPQNLQKWLNNGEHREDALKAIGHLWLQGTFEQRKMALELLYENRGKFEDGPAHAQVLKLGGLMATPSLAESATLTVDHLPDESVRSRLATWMAEGADIPSVENLWDSWRLLDGRDATVTSFFAERLIAQGGDSKPVRLELIRRLLSVDDVKHPHVSEALYFAKGAWSDFTPNDRQQILERFGLYLGGMAGMPKQELNDATALAIREGKKAVATLHGLSPTELLAALQYSRNSLARRGLAQAYLEIDPRRAPAQLAALGIGRRGEPLLVVPPYEDYESGVLVPSPPEETRTTLKRLAQDLRSNIPTARTHAVRAHVAFVLGKNLDLQNYVVDFLLQEGLTSDDRELKMESMRALATLANQNAEIRKRLGDHFAERVLGPKGNVDGSALQALASVDPRRAEKLVENWRLPDERWLPEENEDQPDLKQVAREYVKKMTEVAATFAKRPTSQIGMYVHDYSSLGKDMLSQDPVRAERAVRGLFGLIRYAHNADERRELMRVVLGYVASRALVHPLESVRQLAVEEINRLGKSAFEWITFYVDAIPADKRPLYVDSLRHLNLPAKQLCELLIGSQLKGDSVTIPSEAKFVTAAAIAPAHAQRLLEGAMPKVLEAGAGARGEVSAGAPEVRALFKLGHPMAYSLTVRTFEGTSEPAAAKQGLCSLQVWRAIAGRTVPR